MSRFSISATLLAAVLALKSRAGETSESPPPVTSSSPATNWLTGENFSMGGVLFPHVHFSAVYGRTSSALGHKLGAGHHDPVEDGWTVPGFEVGLSARINEHVEAFGTWHGFWENESPHRFDSEFEEYFLKLRDLPGGFELRGGKYLNRFGLHNANHLHAWDWVDNHLVNGRFLGDDGQHTMGAELTWNLPLPWTSALSVSYGDAQIAEHEPGDEHESEDDEPLFDGGGAFFTGRLLTSNWTNVWNPNDFHQWRFGVSAAWGDNAWRRRTQLYGAHVQYEWRENGLAPGGDYFRWRTEAMLREADAMTGHLPGEEPEDGDEHEIPVPGSFSEWGLYTSAVYGKALRRGVLEGGLRYDFVEGVRDAGLPRRHRLSPGVSYYFNSLRTAFIRGQVNFDDIKGHGSENSVWISAGFNWGGAEVR